MEPSWPSLLAVSVGLGMDALAVSIAAGLAVRNVTPRHVFRLGFHFGLFQFLMPILGWLAGGQLAGYISRFDHWLAFALLALVGGKMFVEAFRHERPVVESAPTRGLMLVTLSVATSIDALAVGMSMAFIGVSVWLPSVVIGLVAAAMTSLGIIFSSRIGSRRGHWADAAGGVILIFIGLRVLVEHLGR